MRFFRRARACAAAIAVLMFGGISSLHAENLVSIKTSEVAAPPTTEVISRLMVVDGRPIAVGADATWLLDENQKAWQRIDWRPQGQVLDIASDGRIAFLLLASSGTSVERIEKLSLVSGKLVSTGLPSLPAPINAAKSAVLQGTLYVAGADADGKPTLLALDTAAVSAVWVAHARWQQSADKSGVVTSLVGQTSALYLTVNNSVGKGDRLLRWTVKDGWISKGELTGSVIEGTARATGQAHVL